MAYRAVRIISLALALGWLGFSTAKPFGQTTRTGERGSEWTVDFQKEIQPVFERNCYSCHGPGAQMSSLRLDRKDAALAGGSLGKDILPGKALESPLYQRVAGLGKLERMPMGGKPLPEEQIKLIRDWINQGAAWPEAAHHALVEIKKHWAFIPPQRPSLPQTMHSSWVRNPIDAFVLARLEQEGLKPSPPADRVTLIRRLSLDLTGLPPTPEEVDAFVADPSPNAYAKQVERLLGSPHYGERWGRVWLDAARYADSNGYEKDMPRRVWAYRDWVINALNHDLPYNQFIIDQIAGDMLPHPTQDEIVATGFLRNSMLNEEGGVDPEQFRMEAMFDRMDAIGKGILGLTIQCAQCHDHKFDPLKQEEYYRMFAFLNNSSEGTMAVYTPQEQMKRAEIFRRTREIEAGLQHNHPDWQERMTKWEEQVTQGQPQWTVVRPTVDELSSSGQKYLPQPDGSFLAQGDPPDHHRVKMTVRTDLQNITAFRLELMTDPNLPLGGPGRSNKGLCALTEFTVEAAPADAPEKVTKVKFEKATADVNPPRTELPWFLSEKNRTHPVTGPVEYAIDGKDETAWGIDVGPGLRNQARKAVFLAASPISNASGTLLTFYLSQRHGDNNGGDRIALNLGRFRLSVTTTPGATADPLPAKVREILSIPRSQRAPAQVQTIFSYWRTTVPEWRVENSKISAIWREYPEGATQPVLQEVQPRETHVLRRGDFLSPLDPVSAGVPAFLPPLPHDASWKNGQPTRLTFAEWLADRGSPTTARSIVNRVWQAYFGIGIVATAENFGTQSEPPSHPELLDWLAVEFMQRGWSLKQLHRLIVMSATYQQSSRVTPELYERDPYNRLLARGPRFRVDAEIVRDIELAASGMLDPKVGGPSVNPPAPAFLFLPPASFSQKPWKESLGEDRYRRALYTFRYRSTPYPMLQVFDAPDGEFACVRRARSDTPLQALTLLNEPLSMELARALASHAVQSGSTEQERLTFAFRRCVARQPTAAESADLLGLLHKETRRFEDEELNPWKFLGGNPALAPLLPPHVTAAQLAGWTVVTRAILNLDETITKE